MVQSRSMVSGPSPGPAPAVPGVPAHPVELTDVAPPEAAQKGAQGGWRLDRGAQGAGRPPGAQPSAASMQSPPAKEHLVPRVGPPRRAAQVEALLDEFGQAHHAATALLTRRWSSKAIWMRSGCSSGSICWVLLFWGRSSVSKTIIPDAKEHFLTPSPCRDAHPFGGLG